VGCAHREFVEAIDITPVVQQLSLNSHFKAVRFEVFANKTEQTASTRTIPSPAPLCAKAKGFSLVHDLAPVTGRPDCRFRVLGPTGSQRSISVCFDLALVAVIDGQRRTPLWIASRFWGLCAEAHLAAYLREAGDCPPNGQLTIVELSEDEMLLATYWRD